MPAQLNFDLPWQGLQAGGAALSGLGGDPQAAMANLGPMYQQQYGAALAMNQQNNQNIQTGYGQLRSEADQVYKNIYSNLDQRYGDVLGRIAGTNTSNIRDIEANARAQSGAMQQSMISRGLGNTTLLNSANRGINSDRQREITRSQEQFAQLGAGYADRIWQDRTNTQQNKIGTMAGLGQAQLGAQERIQAGYPDAGMFGSLAQMYGSQAEAQKNRQQLGGGMMSGGYGASVGTTSSPSPWGSRNPGGGGSSWGGDSWTNSYGGGGGFYQPVGRGGNQTTDQYAGGNEWDTPYAGDYGYDQNADYYAQANEAMAADWGY